MMLVPYYRTFELPWSPTAEVERRFHRVVRNALLVFVAFSILLQLLPTPESQKFKAPALPERVVNLVLEQRKPPPPPKVIEPEKQPDKKIEEPRPVEKPQVKAEPKPEPDRTEQARKQAAKALAVFDELNALRDNSAAARAQQTQTLTNAVAATRSERNMITSATGKGSGGINNAALSRGYGGSTGELAGHSTTQVTTTIGANDPRADVQRTSGSKKGKRDGSEVAQVLDANKSAIFALYTRALRDNPDLQGKVVLKLVITPSGDVLSCDVVSSELNNPELERKLAARIKMIRFPAQDVETLTVTHPIEFFPAG
ncbi:MAG: AgmX/PglI C-terminal domain-containing protein [Steroidobacteraceae bacterium]